MGDFNGDGLEEIAVLFTPKSKPAKTKQLRVLTPLIYPITPMTKKYRRSLIIFQKSQSKWLSENTQVYTLLETASFQLLTTIKKNKKYASLASMLPVNIKSDLIILLAEAGIDAYILG